MLLILVDLACLTPVICLSGCLDRRRVQALPETLPRGERAPRVGVKPVK